MNTAVPKKRYSVKPSLDQQVDSPTIQTAIYQCSVSACYHRLSQHNHSGCWWCLCQRAGRKQLAKIVSSLVYNFRGRSTLILLRNSNWKRMGTIIPY